MRMEKKIDISNKRFKKRPLSHSQLSSFEYDPEQWYDTYILGNKIKANPAMEFGTLVGDSIGTETSMVPGLTPPGVKEYELRANLDDIWLVGFADHYCKDTYTLHENKTSDKPDRWTQAKVDSHPQLTMYALLLFLQDKVRPEDVTMQLNFIPVERGGDMIYRMPEPPVYHAFLTRRTTQDILDYTQYILDTVKKMEEYAKNK